MDQPMLDAGSPLQTLRLHHSITVLLHRIWLVLALLAGTFVVVPASTNTMAAFRRPRQKFP